MHVYTDTPKGRLRHTEAAGLASAILVLPEPDVGDYYHIDWLMWSFKSPPKDGVLTIYDATTNSVLTRMLLSKDLAQSFELLTFNGNGFVGPTSSGLSIELSSSSKTDKTLTLQFR